MRISDWSSDVCSSDLGPGGSGRACRQGRGRSFAGWSWGYRSGKEVGGRGAGLRRCGLRKGSADVIVRVPAEAGKPVTPGARQATLMRRGREVGRSEERRGGREGDGTGRTRW